MGKIRFSGGLHLLLFFGVNGQARFSSVLQSQYEAQCANEDPGESFSKIVLRILIFRMKSSHVYWTSALRRWDFSFLLLMQPTLPWK